MSTRHISWRGEREVKGGRSVGLTTVPSSFAIFFRNSGRFNPLEISGPVKACNGIALLYQVVSLL